MSRLLVLNGLNLTRSCWSACKNLSHVHRHFISTAIVRAFQGRIPCTQNTHAIRGFRIIFTATTASSRPGGGSPRTCTSQTCVCKCENHAPCASCFQKHKRSARCMSVPMHSGRKKKSLCVFACVRERECACSNGPACAF